MHNENLSCLFSSRKALHEIDSKAAVVFILCTGEKNRPYFLYFFIMLSLIITFVTIIFIDFFEFLYSMRHCSFRLAVINVCPVLVPSELHLSTHLPTSE